MKKVLPKTNYRVEAVSVSQYWFSGSPEAREKLDRDAAEELATQIRRHCDVSNVTICFDSPVVCEYCGYAWTEPEHLYNGGCCDADIECAQYLGILDSDANPGSVHIFKDGTAWCAVYKGTFVNIQESECGFGDTPEEAVKALGYDWDAIKIDEAQNK